MRFLIIFSTAASVMGTVTQHVAAGSSFPGIKHHGTTATACYTLMAPSFYQPCSYGTGCSSGSSAACTAKSVEDFQRVYAEWKPQFLERILPKMEDYVTRDGDWSRSDSKNCYDHMKPLLGDFDSMLDAEPVGPSGCGLIEMNGNFRARQIAAAIVLFYYVPKIGKVVAQGMTYYDLSYDGSMLHLDWMPTTDAIPSEPFTKFMMMHFMKDTMSGVYKWLRADVDKHREALHDLVRDYIYPSDWSMIVDPADKDDPGSDRAFLRTLYGTSASSVFESDRARILSGFMIALIDDQAGRDPIVSGNPFVSGESLFESPEKYSIIEWGARFCPTRTLLEQAEQTHLSHSSARLGDSLFFPKTVVHMILFAEALRGSSLTEAPPTGQTSSVNMGDLAMDWLRKHKAAGGINFDALVGALPTSKHYQRQAALWILKGKFLSPSCQMTALYRFSQLNFVQVPAAGHSRKFKDARTRAQGLFDSFLVYREGKMEIQKGIMFNERNIDTYLGTQDLKSILEDLLDTPEFSN